MARVLPKIRCSTALCGIGSKERSTRVPTKSLAQVDAVRFIGTSLSTIRPCATDAMPLDTGSDIVELAALGLFNSRNFGVRPIAQVAQAAVVPPAVVRAERVLATVHC